MADDTLLMVEDLQTVFPGADHDVVAVDGVSLSVARGKTLGIVGESGCGKSMLSLSIMRLVPRPGRIARGRVMFAGQDLLSLPEKAMRAVRTARIAMIFQEPMTSLNPSLTIGRQITEAIEAHGTATAAELRVRAITLLRQVRIASPEQRLDDYPHQMSGGMRQRVMIAIALSCAPELLIADEPTTALDVTVQSQILDLLRDLQQENGMAIVMITHDLCVVAEMADEVAVMYAGRVVERATVADLFDDPQHPYTIGLLGSMPRIDLDRERLIAIEGTVPSAASLPAGCRFRPRCVFAVDACADHDPPLREVAPNHWAACLRAPVEAAA